MEHPIRSQDTLVCNLAPAPIVLKRADVGRAGESAPQAEATGGNAVSLAERSTSDAQVAARNRWLSLGLICICSLMMVLDATIVNVALPAIQKDLGFSQSALAWVVNAYLLTFGGLMLISGRAADLLGRRRVLVWGIALFTGASLVCGLSSSQAMLVIARGVQGIGGSIIGAVALSMIVALFPEQAERAKAMGVWGFVSSGGGTLGVILGGVLTQTANWHWIFLVNVPIGVAALALSRPLLPSIPGTGLGEALDLAGTLAAVVAPLLAVYGIVTVPVKMEEAFATRLDEAVVGIPTGWLPTRCVGDEGAALLRARQHAGHALSALQRSVVGLHEVLFAHSLGRRRQDRNSAVVGHPSHPGAVSNGALLKDSWLDTGDANEVVEEVDQVLWALQSLDVAGHDDAIPARVGELDSVAQQR